MKTYVIIPVEWDYEKDTNGKIATLREQGCFVPSDIIEISERCGALVGCSKTSAIAMVKKLKKDYPYIKFNLLVSETWGNLELVKEF